MEISSENEQRFAAAIRRFDEENTRDPAKVLVAGCEQPRELAWSGWVSDWVLRLAPNAPEELRLAAHCQHLCRWEIPRESYPMTRPGYLKWREDLKRFHARKAAEILSEVGYRDDLIARVRDLNLKKNFPHDPNSRILEDALCLVFLQHQLVPLAQKTSEDKVINALQKSWTKMTPSARNVALSLDFGAKERELLARALGSGPCQKD